MDLDERIGHYSIHKGDEEFNIAQTWITNMEGIEGAFDELEKFLIMDMGSTDRDFTRSAAIYAAFELGKVRGYVYNAANNIWDEDRLSADPASTWHRLGVDVMDTSGITCRYWIERNW